MTNESEHAQPEASASNGLSKLSALQLRMLRLLRESKRPEQISRELGLSKGELATQIRQVLASIGAPDRIALLKMLDNLPRGN